MPEHIDIPEDELPADIEAALAWLRGNMPLQNQVELKLTLEKDLIGWHSSLGRLLRNSFGLWTEGNTLRQWFEGKGIEHPDTMSSIIIKVFWRWLNDKPQQLDELIAQRVQEERDHKKVEEALKRGETVEVDGMRISGCIIPVEAPDAD